MALDRSRPIDLLGTVAGRQQVKLLLVRLHYGVYT
ncbi:antitoxin Xre/MbcA/ParS toxin-binding domain-containing protein [Muricoccus aerilatus]|nr:antitoxin Xre/MbcA/ParS toxin-binding domain-containing protein [Roseomonas aerilata]